MILLACAVAKELAFWKARPGVDVLVTGVGPVDAAAAVAQALAQQRYKLVISAGIAGAFDGAAQIGDGVVVTSERFELDREDGTPIALPGGEAVADTTIVCDTLLVTKLHEAGIPALAGVTVSRVTTNEGTARRLAALGAQVETMEGFAVMRAAQRARVHGVELRGISNRVGDRARSGWDFAAGIAGLQRILPVLFVILDAGHQHPEHP